MLLLYLYEPYFCKTVEQVEGGGVVKVSNRYLLGSSLPGSRLTVTTF